jgi:hypothetical protein
MPSSESQQRSVRSTAASNASAGPFEICEWIRKELDAIDARMRHGYTSWQGERFRKHIRALKRQRDEAGCT